ncbi:MULTISPECIES: RNA polymerase sigma factor [unclassified Novosphingobium]|uniref:RNA polymerase sigma factor n=1 Tax=unclassified Novosphingobium TaxID=2644732 RepID=UPI0025F6821B|nr:MULTISPECIES: RNA polymerase sigma factor [unclassified Novosphingobium]HQV02171.1 RNA polymerase sigma factor [Novosphingobium sp.]
MDIAIAIQAIAREDRRAFDELYRSQQRPLLGYALGLLAGDREAAEDVVDEAFVDIWRQAATFTASGSGQGWIRRIVRNKAVDWLRRNGSARWAQLSDQHEQQADQDPDPEHRAITANNAEWLRLALARISVDQREAVILAYFEQRSVAEIAEIQACPEGTVKTRLFHARLNMRNLLAESLSC